MYCHAISAKFGVRACYGYGVKEKIKFLPIRIAGKVLPIDFLRKKIENHFNKYPETGYYTILDGYMISFTKYIFPRECFDDDPIEVEFEGLKFPAPRRYDTVLKIYYGNYMEIPDESERRTHSVEELDFGRFFISNINAERNPK